MVFERHDPMSLLSPLDAVGPTRPIASHPGMLTA